MRDFSKLAWMDAVRRCVGIPPMQRLVIMHIGDTADRYGNRAWRSNDTVVAELGVNKDTVTVARRNASERGLWVETAAARGGRGGGGRSAEYRLTIPNELVRASPENSGNGPELSGIGPEFNSELSGPGRTPSGSSSGISSGERYVSNARESDPWAEPPAEWKQREPMRAIV